jgi:hypothetical protein
MGYKSVNTMRSANSSTQNSPRSIKINRAMYGAFILLSLYFLLIGAYENSATNLGIALIFDPFDQSVRWDHRPRWQRVWLMAHLGTMLCIGLMSWKIVGAWAS